MSFTCTGWRGDLGFLEGCVVRLVICLSCVRVLWDVAMGL